MKTKVLNIADKVKYELGIFALLLIQALLNFRQLKTMDINFFPYYLSDFSMAKTSRFFIGTIINWLTDNPNEAWLNNFARIILFLGLILAAVLIGRVVRSVDADKRISLYAVILFFCTGSFTMHIFSRFFGMMDIYMFGFAAISLALLGNKYLRWLVPLLCFAGVMINVVFVFSYFPAVLLVMLYLAAVSEKKAGYIILFCITSLSIVALTYYATFGFDGTITVTYEELKQIMETKFGAPLRDSQLEYFTGYLYGTNTQGENYVGGNIFEMSPVDILNNLYSYLFSERLSVDSLVTIGVGSLPVVAVFWGIWISCMRKTKDKGKRFVYFCFMASILCVVLCLLLSTDPIRWYAAGVMCQFAFAFYMFYAKDEAFSETVESIRKFFEDKKPVFVIIYLAYLFIRHKELA